MSYIHPPAQQPQTGRAVRDLFAWCLVGLLPWLFFSTLAAELTYGQAMFMTLALAAIVMWIFRLVPDFVPGLAMLLMVVLLDIVPQSIAFSGFYSQVFFLVFGIFVLAALLAETSWLGRLEQLLLRSQASLPTRLLAVALSGILLTLVVPSPLGRASMVQPLVQRFFRTGRPSNNAFLALAHMHGTTLLSTILLTGNPLNFILIGLLDDQTRGRYQWLGWLQVASVAGTVLAFGLICAIFVCAAIAPKAQGPKAQNRSGPAAQPAPVAIDPMRDWATLGLYAVLLAAIMTRTLHQIPLEWVVLGLAMAVFFFSGISLNVLRRKLDWPTLIFVATVVAWGPMLDQLQLSDWLAGKVPALIPIFQSSLYLGIAVTMLGVAVIRLAVPGAPAFIILASALLPLADTIGVSPWVLGFVILTISEGFVWPYQHGVMSQTVTAMDADRTDYSLRIVLGFNIFFFLLRAAAIFASIPFWHWLNLI